MKIDFDFYTGNIDRFMDIARKQLDYIQKRQSKGLKIPGIIEDHGIIASIFSAASIEATINLYILLPIVLIKDSKIRSFFGCLLTKYFRSPIFAKLNFVCETLPELKNNKVLLKRIEKLFSYRNSIMHSSPEHFETIENLMNSIKVIIPIKNTLESTPKFFFGSKLNSKEEIKLAREHFETAKQFIEIMKPFYSKKLSKKEIYIFYNLIQN